MSLLPILKGEIQARPVAHGIGIHGSFPYGYAPMQETRGFFEGALFPDDETQTILSRQAQATHEKLGEPRRFRGFCCSRDTNHVCDKEGQNCHTPYRCPSNSTSVTLGM